MLCILQEAVKVMAKSLVRNRHAVAKMYGLKSQLQAVSLRIAVSVCGHHGAQSAATPYSMDVQRFMQRLASCSREASLCCMLLTAPACVSDAAPLAC